MKFLKSLFALFIFVQISCATEQKNTQNPAADRANNSEPTSPLFIDPNYHGSCDPEIVWNEVKQRWYIYYTARRATLEKGSYVGTPIGVISSDNLRDWQFEGYASFTDSDGTRLKGNKDMPVTFWAPGIFVKGDTMHMYVTYKNNITPPWGGSGHIRHYTAKLSDPLQSWTQASQPAYATPDPIDATLIHNTATGYYQSFYRVGNWGGIQWSRSKDLKIWENMGKISGDVNTLGRKKFGYQEAPYVFKFRDTWWMLTDPHKGLAVYKSNDSIHWQYNNTILAGEGTRQMDGSRGRHPSVAIHDGRAFIFYHVEPNRAYHLKLPATKRPINQKKSVLQMAELSIESNKLIALRDNPILLH